MPLLSVKNVSADVRLGIWKIEESVETFISSSPALSLVYQQEIAICYSEARRLEKLAVYSLLWEMTGSHLRLAHNAAGKPMVEGWNISVSHTKGYAAVILSRTSEVAVDIEYISNRVSRIADKFMRPDEDAPSVIDQLINWCAKETLYKFCSSQNLQYFEMKISPADFAPSKRHARNLKDDSLHVVCYEITSEFVVAYMWA